MSEAATKTCPQCAETIKAAAKVCPFCQTRLGRLASRSQAIVPLLPAAFFMALFIGFAVWLDSDSLRHSGRQYSPHSVELVVSGASLVGQNPNHEFACQGFVTNRGSYPWRVRELELRFLNPDGTLLDVLHQKVRDPFVVQPGCEVAFHAELGRLPEAVRTAPFETRVHEATDGNLPYKPD